MTCKCARKNASRLACPGILAHQTLVIGSFQYPDVLFGSFQYPDVLFGSFQYPDVLFGSFQYPDVLFGGFQYPVALFGQFPLSRCFVWVFSVVQMFCLGSFRLAQLLLSCATQHHTNYTAVRRTMRYA